MHPHLPLVEPLPLPAPLWLAWLLQALTFTLHLLAMNALLGGLFLAAASRRATGGPDGPHHRAFLALFTRFAPVAVACTVSLGVAPLLFTQVLYGRLFFTSSILMAWPWLSVIPLLIAGYCGTYLLACRGEAAGRPAPALGLLVTLLFTCIAFLYVTNMSLMLRPHTFVDAWRASGRGLHLNLGDPTFLPRLLHMLLGACAVAGALLSALGLARRADDPPFARFAVRRGLRWFGIATAANLAVGFWYLLAQPSATIRLMMGGSAYATALFALGLLGSLAAVGLAHGNRRAEPSAGKLAALFATLAGTLVTMILLRDRARQAALDAAGFVPTPWVEPQEGAIALFLLLLVAAVATIAWMVRALVRGREGEPLPPPAEGEPVPREVPG